jgi:hypothetical protein
MQADSAIWQRLVEAFHHSMQLAGRTQALIAQSRNLVHQTRNNLHLVRMLGEVRRTRRQR